MLALNMKQASSILDSAQLAVEASPPSKAVLHPSGLLIRQLPGRRLLTWPRIRDAMNSVLPPGAAQASSMFSPGCGSRNATTRPAASSCTCAAATVPKLAC